VPWHSKEGCRSIMRLSVAGAVRTYHPSRRIPSHPTNPKRCLNSEDRLDGVDTHTAAVVMTLSTCERYVGRRFEGAYEGQGAAGAFGPPAHCKPDAPIHLRTCLQPGSSQSRQMQHTPQQQMTLVYSMSLLFRTFSPLILVALSVSAPTDPASWTRAVERISHGEGIT
jgi:hypothetical protein